MSLNNAFKLTKKFYPLVFVPIIYDFLQIGDILRLPQEFTLKFTVPTAIPSLTQILANPPQGANESITVTLPYSYLGGVFLIFSVLFLLLSVFLKGGFLGCVLAGIKDEEISINTFINSARKFFARFLLQLLILFVLLFAVASLYVVLGSLALLLFFGVMILLFYLIFWDYIIVVEDAKLIDAAKISISLVGSNIGKVLYFILPIALLTALFSVMANVVFMTSIVLISIAIIIYAFFGTTVVFAMMSFYMDSLRSTE